MLHLQTLDCGQQTVRVCPVLGFCVPIHAILPMDEVVFLVVCPRLGEAFCKGRPLATGRTLSWVTPEYLSHRALSCLTNAWQVSRKLEEMQATAYVRPTKVQVSTMLSYMSRGSVCKHWGSGSLGCIQCWISSRTGTEPLGKPLGSLSLPISLQLKLYSPFEFGGGAAGALPGPPWPTLSWLHLDLSLGPARPLGYLPGPWVA